MLPRLACLAVVLALVAPVGASGAAKARPRVTFIGDSVAAALNYVSGARRVLGKGLDLHLDLKVCRRLVAPSCTYQGVTPATALQVINSTGRALGETVVIMVGFNDTSSRYRSDLDTVMRALRKARVRSVVWVTLTEARESYRLMNGVIRNAAKRWPQLTIADWASLSAGKDWFAGDGLHLEPSGAMALARLVHGKVLAVT